MSDLQRITGSGGIMGGKKNSTPVEEPDTLRSNAFASILYLIGEGQIKGLVDGMKSIYLDDTPLIDAAGKVNFQNVTFEYRGGTQAQTAIKGVRGTESDQPINVKLSFNTPSTRTLTDANADSIKVRMLVSSLQDISDKGDVRQTSVSFRIEVTNNGTWETRITDTLRGKTTSPYQWDYLIALRGNSPWSIRVTRLTPDSTTNKLQNDLNWSSLASIISNRLRYPNSALMMLRFPAEQFNSIPQVSLDLDGEFIGIPHNYNPVTRAYNGIFNGSLVSGYSNNPAWVMYDLMTNRRYGCGKYIDASQIDVWSLYQIAQYCDGLVPNGRGAMEPRFTCNAFLQNREDAYKVLNTLASVFRGMLYWSAGTIFATQDAPASPVRLFTDANVIQEVDDSGRITKPPFIYAGSALSSRHTVALVSWSDPNDGYKNKIESVEDLDGIARYGYNETEVVAFACTSQGQARRTGEWLLYSERIETETITFSVGSEGMLVRPGEVIKVADSARAGLRYGGRLISSTATTVTLDAPVGIAAGFAYTLSLLRADGTQREYAVTTGAGNHSTLAVTGMPDAPPPGSVWALASVGLQPQLFRVISAVEQEQETYEITALAHNPSKYAAIELDRPLQEQIISAIPSPTVAPLPPGGLTITESLYTTRSSAVRVKATLTFTPTPSPYANEYQGQYKESSSGQWTPIGNTLDTFLEVLDLAPGRYDFRVRAINALGVGGEWVTASKEVFGLAAPPAAVTGVSISALGDSLLISWQRPLDLDVLTGGRIDIKHTSRTENVTWSDGTLLASVPGSATSVVVPLLTGTYQLMAIDSMGVPAATATRIAPNIGVATAQRLNGRIQVSPDFADQPVSAPKINCTVSDGGLRITSNLSFENAPNFDLIPNIDTYLPPVTSTLPENGSYFAGGLFVSSVLPDSVGSLNQIFNYRVKLAADFAVQSVSEISSVDTIADIDLIEKLDAAIETPEGVTANLQIAVLRAGTVYNPFPDNWQQQYQWQDFRAGEYEGRIFLFRVLLKSNGVASPLVDRLAIDWDFVPRIESGTASITGSGTIQFGQSFGSLPDVTATVLDMQSFELARIQRQMDSFSISLMPDNVPRTISWIARGFGAYTGDASVPGNELDLPDWLMQDGVSRWLMQDGETIWGMQGE